MLRPEPTPGNDRPPPPREVKRPPIRWTLGCLAVLLAVVGGALSIPPLMHQPLALLLSPLCLAGACASIATLGVLWYAAPDRAGPLQTSPLQADASTPRLSRKERLLWTVPFVWFGLYALSELRRQVTIGNDPFYMWSLLVAVVPGLVLRLRLWARAHGGAADPASERGA